jgi:hypothetical protein
LSKSLNNSPNSGGGTTKPSGAGAKPTSEAGAEVDSETYSYANPEFIKSALGKATSEAINDIIAQLGAASLPESGRAAKSRNASDALRHAPGKILAVVDNTTIIVSLGSNQGFKEGDQLDLFETTDIKDDKGNVVFTDQKLVGELVITKCKATGAAALIPATQRCSKGGLSKASD